jgi:micrococcal nuclease
LRQDLKKKIAPRWLPLTISLIILAWGALGLSACANKPAGPPAQALVVQVIDGDTLVLSGGAHVRLLGIDAPEMAHDGQPADFLAYKAKVVLTELALHRRISLQYDLLRYDHYGRLLAYLYLPDHTFINATLVRRGLARVYTIAPNFGHREELLTAQRQAIEADRGIWKKLLQQDEPYYIGNKNTLRLHRPNCPFGAHMARSNRVRFTSLKKAFLEGYSPCRSCKP